MRALISVHIEKLNSSDSASGATFPSRTDVLTSFSDMSLDPSNLPELDNTNSDERTRLFQEIAKPIMDKMPEERQSECIQKLIYASFLDSSTRMMVTQENAGLITIRLWNQRMEVVQNACERIVKKLFKYNEKGRRGKKDVRYHIQEEIQILESGLESPTIAGVVHKSRLKRLWDLNSRELIISMVTSALFITAVAIQYFSHDLGQFWNDRLDRLSIALLVTVFVSIVSVTHTFSQIPKTISWEFKHLPRRFS